MRLMRTMGLGDRFALFFAAAALGALTQAPATANAQPAPDVKKAAEEPARPEPKAPDLTLPAKGPDPLATALAPQQGGLTPDAVAESAVKTRRSIRAKAADLRAAQAKVDQALVNFFPRVSATATFLKLSEVESAGLGGGAIVGAKNPGLLLAGPCPAGVPAPACVVDSKGELVGAAKFSFPTINHSYSLTAQIALPISDYVLRISQGYAAASHGANAAKLLLEAEKLQVAADARISFFNWARAKGQAVVIAQSVATAKAHVADAKVAQAAGMVSRADVLRIEAQVAAAEQGLAAAQAFVLLAEEQLRILLQAPADQGLTLGVDILGGSTDDGPSATLEALQKQALERRLEIRALDETQYSLKNLVSLARAGYFPRLDAFADVNYANPNQRVFPSKDEWNMTWDVGIRASWTINDTFSALGAVAEAQAKAQSVGEQKAQLMEGLRLEVTNAYAELQKAAASRASAERGLEAAEESLRVRQLLFKAGKATATDLVDAEREVTAAQFARIEARVGLLVAQTRLLHATGRDMKQAEGER